MSNVWVIVDVVCAVQNVEMFGRVVQLSGRLVQAAGCRWSRVPADRMRGSLQLVLIVYLTAANITKFIYKDVKVRC